MRMCLFFKTQSTLRSGGVRIYTNQTKRSDNSIQRKDELSGGNITCKGYIIENLIRFEKLFKNTILGKFKEKNFPIFKIDPSFLI